MIPAEVGILRVVCLSVVFIPLFAVGVKLGRTVKVALLDHLSYSINSASENLSVLSVG